MSESLSNIEAGRLPCVADASRPLAELTWLGGVEDEGAKESIVGNEGAKLGVFLR